MNIQKTNEYKCDKCNKIYKQKKRFESHICYKCDKCDKSYMTLNQMKKHKCIFNIEEKNEKYFMIAYKLYKLFNNNKNATIDKFINFNYYNEFIEFSKFGLKIKINNIEHYFKYLLDNRININKWKNENLYYSWICDSYKKESFNRALSKSINTIDKWGMNNNSNNFFNDITTYEIILLIESGKISPWILLSVGHCILEKLDDNQVEYIDKYLDLKYWYNLLEKNIENVKYIKELFKYKSKSDLTENVV